VIGIIANPSSGRDIRRLLARASVFPTSEKINVVLRLLAAVGALGIDEAWMIPDPAQIAATVAQSADAQRKRGLRFPTVHLLDMPITDSVEDTLYGVERMVAMGLQGIAVLGGDGTHRAVARHCANTPLATLSSGTNNAFPALREATTTGLALALVVTQRVPEAVALRRNKVLQLTHGKRRELALVDICIAHQRFLGARAVWQPHDLSQLFVTFADPNVIGLSAIAGWLLPTNRQEPWGVHVSFGPGMQVLAPIGPGLIEPIPIAQVARLLPNQSLLLPPGAGTIAFDGEREIEFTLADQIVIELRLDGPWTIGVEATLDYASRHGLLRLNPDTPLR
jgi:predicted polyphosphate/ATP-dependent NAD kinase